MESPIRSLGHCSRGNGINASIETGYEADANVNNVTHTAIEIRTLLFIIISANAFVFVSFELLKLNTK